MSKAKEFRQWKSERMGHSYPIHLAAEAIKELEDRIAKLESDKADLRDMLQQHRRFCVDVVSGYEGVKFYDKTKQLLNKK